MKIKEILSEQNGGFWSSFGKALLPKAIKTALDKESSQRNLTQDELARLAYNKFGPAPGLEDFGHAGWLEPEHFSRLVTPKPSEVDAKKLAKLAKQTRKAAKEKDAVMKMLPSKSAPAPAAEKATISATNIPAGQRLTVTNPQGNAKFYKYPDGRWTDEFGITMPGGSHQALNQFADTAGRIEPIPATGKSVYQSRGGRRGR